MLMLVKSSCTFIENIFRYMFGVKLKENFKVESPNDSTESFLTCITNFTVLV